MARFSRGTVLLILAVLVLLSIGLRYPLVEHERHQTDSYFIHSLTESIVRDGYASWTFHPLSYIGYYPFSYPSGVPFLLAELSSMTGVNVELCILLMNMAVAVLFCLAVFGLSRQFLVKDEHALLATFFAVVASRFVDTTYWVASARGPLVAMMVLVALVAFRSAVERRTMLWMVTMMFIAVTFVIHHMAVLLALFGLGYVLASVEVHFLLPKIKIKRRLAAIGINLMTLTAVLVVAFGFMSYFREMAQSAFADSSLYDFENPFLAVLVGASASYLNQIGFILLFAVFGAIAVIWRHRLDTNLLFPVALLIIFIPMINNSIYVSMVIGPFVAVLGTRWIVQLSRSRRKKLFAGVLVLLMVSSIALPLWSCDRWNAKRYAGGDTIEVDNQVFTDATYLRVTYAGTYALTNSVDKTLQLRALTGIGFLGSGIYLALNDDVVSRDVHRNVTWSSRNFPVNLYIWFEYAKEPNVDHFVLVLSMNGVSYLGYSVEMKDYFVSHDHKRILFVVDNRWPDSTISQYNRLAGRLMPELMNAQWWSQTRPEYLDSYSIYQSGGITLYMLELPIS